MSADWVDVTMDNVVQFPQPQNDTPAQKAKELVGICSAQVVCDLANNGVNIKDPEVLNAMGAIVMGLKSIAAYHYDLTSFDEVEENYGD